MSKIMNLIEKYSDENLIQFIKDKITNFSQENIEDISVNNENYNDARILGKAELGEINLLLLISVKTTQLLTSRSGKKAQYDIAKKILKDQQADGAIFVFHDSSGNFRFSFIQANYTGTKKTFTHFRRYTYFVSVEQSNRTFKDRIGAGKWQALDDILEAFSVEPLNKAFYQEIQMHFDKLKKKDYLTMMADEKERPEFSVRFIGRLLFCWFLKNLQSVNDIPLIPNGLLSKDKVESKSDYYRKVIEPLFFEVLNTPIKERHTNLKNHESIPYLNGGLFEKQQSDNNSLVKNEWFIDFFETLSHYNFTIDENSSNDTEVSIDPEMLGTIFENLLAEQDPDTQKSARKASGSFYTPRVIVDYMVEQSLTAHLQQKTGMTSKRIQALFTDTIDDTLRLDEHERIALLEALFSLKMLDPACGSGAFPMGMLQKIVAILAHLDADGSWWKDAQHRVIKSASKEAKELKVRLENANVEYIHKLGVVGQCLYGSDIQPIATEMTKLRCFLSLIIDEKIDDNADNRGILPLPNLEFKFVTANSLLNLPTVTEKEKKIINPNWFSDLQDAKEGYLNSYGQTKVKQANKFKKIQAEISALITGKLIYSQFKDSLLEKICDWQPFTGKSTNWFEPKLMFGIDKFDLVIGNPPYVSTKDVKAEEKKLLKKQYGFADDLYSHFYFRGMDLLSPKGVLSYITSKTFWTIQTKRNVRDLLLSKKIDYIFDSANPFESAMVDTGIIGVSNTPVPDNHHITFLDGREDLAAPHRYSIEQSIYQQAQNTVIFEPSAHNLAIYEQYNHKVKQLHKQWWGKVKTSGDIAKNQQELQDYRDNLQVGDIALLGCLTEGGQGLATANNGKYVAVKEGTKQAHNVRSSRPKKLLEAIKKNAIAQFQHIDDIAKARDFLDTLSENDITQLFDRLKEKYGRDIFGQGYLFRIFTDIEMACVDDLSEDEKQNGIASNKAYYVPYDKGDKDGNRWYLETPFAIAWTKENVAFLKKNSGKKGKGMPVVRNPQFYFRKGFCWTDVNSTYLKSRLKMNGVFDVLSMCLFTKTFIPDWYYVCLINSKLLSLYVDTFINSTSHFQINDARQLPIIIPTETQLAYFKTLFDQAVNIQKQKFALTIADNKANEQLEIIQMQLDKAVNQLYGIED